MHDEERSTGGNKNNKLRERIELDLLSEFSEGHDKYSSYSIFKSYLREYEKIVENLNEKLKQRTRKELNSAGVWGDSPITRALGHEEMVIRRYINKTNP